MSRETKVGLVVALSFLLLVGGVLGYKLYFSEEPLLGFANGGTNDQPQTGDKKPEADGQAEPKPAKPSDEGTKESKPPEGRPDPSALARTEPPAAASGPPATEEPFKKPEEPVKSEGAARPNASAPSLHGRPGFPPEEEKSKPAGNLVATGPSLRPMPPAAAEPPPAADEMPKPGPPPAEGPGLTGKPPERPEAKAQSEPPSAESVKPLAGERPAVGAPMLPALPDEKPKPSSPAGERPMSDDQGGPPPADPVKLPATDKTPPAADDLSKAPPPLAESPGTPPALPMDRPMTVLPPAPPPPAADVKPGPASPPPADLAPRITGPAGSSSTPAKEVPPPAPPDAFERKYDAPVLGKPVPDPNSRLQASGTPVSRQPDKRGGLPVTVRPQPGTPQRSESGGVPVVIQPPTWNTRDGRAPAQVDSFDMEVYILKPGDTYASVSQLRYRSDRYQSALAQFNRERDARLASPQAGMAIYLPPAGYLERRYGVANPAADASNGARPTATRASQSEAVRPGTPGSSGIQPVSTGNGPAAPSAGDTKAAAQAEWAQSAGTKRYRVRPNDTIWNIAKITLGSGERWPDILRLNRDVVRDVNQLQAGTVLRLPEDARVDASETAP